ncbi:hypothetical protein CRG98_001611 [Punica granatum]|uniref:Uncharacterized protein n=1 Tax=Punica granatum TaxID=22663 RepID=A0A2I0LBF1_PUNGR|nr:hypothetical protein CRG98_001611 [Punica granatum]
MAKFCFYALIALLSVHLALSAELPQILPSPAPKLADDSTPTISPSKPTASLVPLQPMRLMARFHPRRRCLPWMRLPPLPRPHPPSLHLNLHVNV